MAAIFDAAVIGGGVVGCATLRRLAVGGLRTVLLEKSADILSGASKGNSGILHTGFDAPAGSLELRLMQSGYREYMRIAPQLNLPMLETGAMVVAWTDAEMHRLGAVEELARANGVDDVAPLSRAQVLEREPHLSQGVRGGLLVPGEHVIDPWSAPLAYALQAVAHGAEVRRQAELLGGEHDGEAWTLQTSQGAVRARWVINCAGLFGDVVQQRLTGASAFQIKPRKGQFAVFDKAAAGLLRTIVLALPNERTKGVVLTRTAFGNVLVGPTAEEQDDRQRAAVDTATLEWLVEQAVAVLPALADVDVTATYAGLRPATQSKEYHITLDRDRTLVTAGGIRSTGLTAALGIAGYVAELVGCGEAAPVAWPRVPMLAEHGERAWAQPGDSEIVCHCETVTRQEVEDALTGPLPAGDIGGLKRRTRAGMGRCQGFYCNGRIARLAADRLASPLAVGVVAG